VIVDFVTGGESAHVGDAYRVEARIVVWEAEEVMKLPVGALSAVAARGRSLRRGRDGRSSPALKLATAMDGRPRSSVDWPRGQRRFMPATGRGQGE
jgi:hypothetical protein